MEIDPKDVGVNTTENAQYHSHDDSFNTLEDDPASDTRTSSDEVDSDSDDDSDDEPAHHDPVFHLQKWKRLKKDYNDQYLDLFNEFCKEDLASEDQSDLQASQVGAVIWSSEAKEKVFTAVARFGRHDLWKLSKAVGTKSVVEVSAYLEAVREAHIDRQIFKNRTNHISTTDIPAAVEISRECELALEKAADALGAYQEQYDITAGQKDKGFTWLIDRHAARIIDAENDNRDLTSKPDAKSGKGVGTGNRELALQEKLHPSRVFKFSRLLELSEEFFMNHPSQSSFPHWKSVAEPGQRPAITEDSVKTLFEMVVARLRTIMNTSIQVANARLSSMATNGYSPARILNQSDVATALEILNMPPDPWEYWVGMARRNQFQVITGSHSKGESRQQLVTYEIAEAALTPRRGRGRRRSMSIGSDISSPGSDFGKQTALPELEANVRSEETGERSLGSLFSSSEEDKEEERSLRSLFSSSEEDEKGEAKQGRSNHDISTGSESLDDIEAGFKMSQEKKNALLDEERDEYMENLDQANRVAEETRLWSVLGKRPAMEDEEDELKTLRRPKSLRKTQDELRGWTSEHMAPWEYYGPLNSGELASGGREAEETEAETDKL